MLKKLFVHEWKDTWKLLTILNVAVILLSLSGLIVFNNRNMESVMESSNNNSVGYAMFYGSYMFIYILSLAVLTLGSMLFFYIRFYRNLYTDQGYLMHTLPVTGKDLILSKTFVAMIWRVIATVVCTFSILIVVWSAIAEDGAEMWREMKEVFTQLKIENGTAVVAIILVILMTIGAQLFEVFLGYLAISIGQQVSKNKVLGSIGIYIGIHVLINIVKNIGTQVFVFRIIREEEAGMFDPSQATVILTLLIMDVLIFALCYGMYMLIHHFMKNKLNLD
ncbi:MAG: hypothetical protein K5739_02765 [Lachnospiraceae bacterium]|nr:hypothetical protein [Lachnospiraceae bacterium]